jgi:putative ABC transport system permease protein
MRFDEIRRDVEGHIQREIRDNIDRGMTPETARTAALRKIGNPNRIVEDTWGAWRAGWVERVADRLAQDTRYALRALVRNPGFSAVAILTLALGIGMNSAIFTVVNAVLLRPLPYPDADRLVWLTEGREGTEMVRVPDYFDWKARSRSFEKIVPYGYDFNAAMDFGSQAERVGTVTASDEFLALTGAAPEVGRLFTAGARNQLLITHKLWVRRFGGDPRVVGKPVVFKGQPFTICGVLPESYRFALPLEISQADLPEIEAYIPGFLEPRPRENDGRLLDGVVGKLRPGVPLSQAVVEMEAIQSDVARQYPKVMAGMLGLRIAPLQDRLVGESRRALLVLLAAVAFVLLIAGANIANLTLARATSRQREIAIRAAIGAGRLRMITQMLAEGIVLALLGGAAGLLIARATLGAVIHLGSHAVPRLGEAAIDLRVLGFTFGLSTVTGVLFSLGPAISLSRAGLGYVLKEGAATVSASASRIAVRRFLMAGEIAITLVLLVSAGLMVRSFWRMTAHPPGFAPESILTMKVTLWGPAYRGRSAQTAYFDRLLDRLGVGPDISAAGITNVPLRGMVKVEGLRFGSRPPGTSYHSVSAGYFQAMGMRLAAGRWLNAREPAPAVMINESFARAVFGVDDPLGRRLMLPTANPTQDLPATIVGVVADLRYEKLDARPGPQVYVPYREAIDLRTMDIMVRTASDPALLAASIRERVAGLDRTPSVYDVQTLEQSLAGSIAPRRFNLLLLGLFAAAALLLAVVGIYGVMGYAVTRRTHEIGIRMALGARRGEVVGMVVRQGMAMAAGGVAVGAAAAMGVTRVMKSLLYETAPTDGPTFAVVCAVLSGAALLACCLPALRASKVDPVVALRYE